MTVVDARPAERKRVEFNIPSLDGIRAFAVVLVFLAHAGMNAVPGGLGVTIFFFLSGYLITSLLRREQERKGRIDLRGFYLRRVLRIWPPLYIFLGFAVILCLLADGFAPPRMEPLTFQLLHLANYYRVFGDQPGIPGTGVLWSLAVEEHFYLLFPALLIFLFPRYNYRQIAVILGGLCLLLLAWRCLLVWGMHVEVDRTYKATDTRIDSIMYGCILALWRNPYMDAVPDRSVLRKGLMLGIGASLIGITLVIRNEQFRETFRYTLQGIALFPIFTLAVTDCRCVLFRWLNWPVVRAVGIVSYSVYLCHYLMLYVGWKICGRESLLLSGLVAASLTAAYAAIMYFLVERPCAKLRRRLHA